MSTNYTATLLTEPTDEHAFAAFVWRCAHAFLPVGRQGGDTSTVPLRFVADERAYQATIENTKNRIAVLDAQTDEDFAAAQHASAALTSPRKTSERSVYQQMYAQVMAWTPPAAYQSLRDFMKAQLARELDFVVEAEPIQSVDPEARQQALRVERWRLATAVEQLAKLVDQVERLNAWQAGLAQVIGLPPRIGPAFSLDR